MVFFFNLISQGKDFIRKNQFLEILILVFIDSNLFLFSPEKGVLQDNLEEVLVEFRDFLMKLDYSGGWTQVQLASGLTFNNCRFLKIL